MQSNSSDCYDTCIDCLLVFVFDFFVFIYVQSTFIGDFLSLLRAVWVETIALFFYMIVFGSALLCRIIW